MKSRKWKSPTLCQPVAVCPSGLLSDMVFPPQCRELIVHQRSPVAVASTPPVEAASAPTQNGAEVSGMEVRSSTPKRWIIKIKPQRPKVYLTSQNRTDKKEAL